jgi:hypothetical protein
MIRELLTQLDERLEKVTGHESVEQAEPTQLRLAVHRLGMFAEHLDQLAAMPAAIPDDSGMLPSRKELNAQALAAGMEAPEKLPNKQALADAIQAVGQPKITEPVAPESEAEPDAPAATSSRI